MEGEEAVRPMTLDATLFHRFPGFTLDVAFQVDKPGVTALFGPSGSGKTTCINAIAGLLRPERGLIRINGADVLDTENRIFVPARRRQVGYVFQDARLFPHMTVTRNLDFGARRSARPPPPAERRKLVSLLGLEHLMARRPSTLSGGERQRVALARALMSGPQILLLDEPLAALDQGRKAEVIPYLERIRDEARIPIVYVSHSIDEVTRLANDVVLINDGSVAAHAPVQEIMARLDLFPLTGRFEAGAVIEGTIRDQDDENRMTQVGFDDGRLWVPRVKAAIGSEIRLRLRARDIMVSLSRPRAISANNILAAKILDIREEEGPYLDVQLACGRSKLLARVTRMSRQRLKLVRGQNVYAVIKSVSVEQHTPRRGSLDRGSRAALDR